MFSGYNKIPHLYRLYSRTMTLENVSQNVESVVSPKKIRLIEPNALPSMNIALVHPDAKLPVYGSSKAAGMDLHSCEDTVVPAKGKTLVGTGLKMAIPTGYYGRVAPRSGLAVKNFIDVGAGVIDEDYRGELKVLLFNFGDQEFTVNKGDRIAQMVLEKYSQARLVTVAEGELDSTERGVGGFGSTGVSS